jgi:hypothetical protein
MKKMRFLGLEDIIRKDCMLYNLLNISWKLMWWAWRVINYVHLFLLIVLNLLEIQVKKLIRK